jgi:hypothetical protein
MFIIDNVCRGISDEYAMRGFSQRGFTGGGGQDGVPDRERHGLQRFTSTR